MASLQTWNPYYLALYFGARAFTNTLGSLEIVGTENIPAGACVFAANHVSHLDPPLVGSCIPREIHFLARKTLFANPVLGHIIARANAIPVDLEKGMEVGTFKRLRHLAASGESTLIFPEGTRSASGEMGDAKGGTGMLACSMSLTVVPVRVFGAYDLLPRGSRLPVPGARVSVVFGRPLKPADFDPGKKHPDRYLEATKVIMEAIAALPEPERAIA